MEKRHAFTLTEALVGATIAMLVLAIVSGLLIGMLRTWNTNSSTLRLSVQSRLMRERLLYGVQGEFGLRHAKRSSILYTTNSLQFQDSETASRFTVILETNKTFRIQDSGGSNVFSTPSDILIKSSAVSWASNLLVMDLVLSIDDGQKVWTQAQQIRTYLLNE